ncbi:3-deoxy-D-arabinoheptulosonate-7-phosphate synthase [Desulfacinum hydrothermale DSM 13146]|uniref:3-deoxy-D-arabinoheptulosonate-7-phosphate synthase n=1 Tax=Desulfacinum hydrothermale DSM 13146 TaxID=1121390 RepID=A0A1W1X511_9BACT|nr:3-deoxy-7-phosphoheptulonate synthase [Desulfacinum hydrothermale]SMC18893.1 3-deoxy-D-arabinoheptulosonate-7-phosphate synthase [Desulfacinum hydrothermale DSM 13146]
MIVVMKPDHTQEELRDLLARIEKMGLRTHVSKGERRTIIGVIGDRALIQEVPFTSFSGVEAAHPILQPYKLVSREFKEEDTVVRIGDHVELGGKAIPIIAGPCAVEGREVLDEIADALHGLGVPMLRGGAFKPRTSPYSFQGLGELALKYMSDVRERTGMPIVTEVMDPRDLLLVHKYADVLQIGTRNMQNFRLLTEVGQVDKPVILKRGMSATIKEFLMSAEYIVSHGNEKVILCERGIRTFESETRNTLDLSAVPLLKKLTHLPVIVDPSHALGRTDLIPAMSCAAVAAGADGLMLEVHVRPQEALSDGAQSLTPQAMADLLQKLEPVARAVGRSILRTDGDSTRNRSKAVGEEA